VENAKGKKQYDDPGVNRRIILKLNFKEILTGFNWLRISSIGGDL
jgi:hypothetical protein